MSSAPSQDWVWLAVCCTASLAAFYYAFRNLRRARLIEDVPTARIRSAAQGQVELEGVAGALPGEPILAPLTCARCCWWRYQVERRRSENRWERVEHGVSDDFFVLDDGTGTCLVDPEGAEVTPTDRSVWYGDSARPLNLRPERSAVRPQGWSWAWPVGARMMLGAAISADFRSENYRYTEERIYFGDRLYVIGHFRSEDDLHHGAEREQLTRDKLRLWKHDQAGLLRRFDRNGDGRIDPAEWERARAAAAEEASTEEDQLVAGRIPHRLSRSPDKTYPFLISSLPQYDLVRRYRLSAAASAVGFFLFGGIAAWLLSSRVF
jgi:hypothetical protein